MGLIKALECYNVANEVAQMRVDIFIISSNKNL